MSREIDGEALVSLFLLGDWLVPASLQQSNTETTKKEIDSEELQIKAE